MFSCRQHWKSSRNPREGCREVNKTFTFQCCYPCCEYLSCYWKELDTNFSSFGIVSIPSWALFFTLLMMQKDFHILFCNLTLYLLIIGKSFVEHFLENLRNSVFGAFHSSTWSLKRLQSHSRCAINHFIRKILQSCSVPISSPQKYGKLSRKLRSMEEKCRLVSVCRFNWFGHIFIPTTRCQECCFLFFPGIGQKFFGWSLMDWFSIVFFFAFFPRRALMKV